MATLLPNRLSCRGNRKRACFLQGNASRSRSSPAAVCRSCRLVIPFSLSLCLSVAAEVPLSFYVSRLPIHNWRDQRVAFAEGSARRGATPSSLCRCESLRVKTRKDSWPPKYYMRSGAASRRAGRVRCFSAACALIHGTGLTGVRHATVSMATKCPPLHDKYFGTAKTVDVKGPLTTKCASLVNKPGGFAKSGRVAAGPPPPRAPLSRPH